MQLTFYGASAQCDCNFLDDTFVLTYYSGTGTGWIYWVYEEETDACGLLTLVLWFSCTSEPVGTGCDIQLAVYIDGISQTINYRHSGADYSQSSWTLVPHGVHGGTNRCSLNWADYPTTVTITAV